MGDPFPFPLSDDENKTLTAKVLGIGLNTLWRKLKAYGVINGVVS